MDARRATSSSCSSGVGADHDDELFLGGEMSPTFFGSALTNFGVRLLLDAVIDLAPAPTARARRATGKPRPLDAPFSGFVFKVQANMDRSHRDRIAFLRVCSGRFERGMVVTHGRHRQAVRHQVRPLGVRRRSARPSRRPGPATSSGLVNATDVRVGDTLYVDEHGRRSRRIPSFAPEHFSVARVRDTGRFKQFRGASPSSTRRAWCRCCATPTSATRRRCWPRSGRCSSTWPCTGSRTSSAPRSSSARPATPSPAAPTRPAPPPCGPCAASTCSARADGTLLALFESRYWLDRLAGEQPELTLEPLVAGELGRLSSGVRGRRVPSAGGTRSTR